MSLEEALHRLLLVIQLERKSGFAADLRVVGRRRGRGRFFCRRRRRRLGRRRLRSQGELGRFRRSLGVIVTGLSGHRRASGRLRGRRFGSRLFPWAQTQGWRLRLVAHGGPSEGDCRSVAINFLRINCPHSATFAPPVHPAESLTVIIRPRTFAFLEPLP